MQNASRIELHPFSQSVRVHVDGKLFADSTQALKLEEQVYPPRHYFSQEDSTYGRI